jgi:hypothetical protein
MLTPWRLRLDATIVDDSLTAQHTRLNPEDRPTKNMALLVFDDHAAFQADTRSRCPPDGEDSPRQQAYRDEDRKKFCWHAAPTDACVAQIDSDNRVSSAATHLSFPFSLTQNTVGVMRIRQVYRI